MQIRLTNEEVLLAIFQYVERKNEGKLVVCGHIINNVRPHEDAIRASIQVIELS